MRAPPPLPPQLVARARAATRILEVGTGTDFSTSLALAREAPHARLIVSDVDERVLLAPPETSSMLLDLTGPPRASTLAELGHVDLVVAVRLPEELQLPAARIAHALHADLAVRALKDEWADVSIVRRKFESWSGGWRFYPA